MSKQVAITENLVKLEKSFKAQNAFGLAFENECLFAKQQIMKNDFTRSTAQNNPESLKGAILNVAAIGISLNPASAHAYLVPRDGRICLDISYRGLVKLATDIGAIEWAKAVLVYKGDEFKWRGPTQEPVHEADVFDKDRINAADPLQNLVGGYCLAKLSTGEYMVEVMTAGEILEVKNSSKAQNGPWKGRWAGEMAKKTLVKRAYKSWPQSGGRERLEKAVEVVNEHEGFIVEEDNDVADYLEPSKEQAEKYLELVKGDPLELWCWYNSLDERVKVSLPGRNYPYPPGEKGATRKKWAAAVEQGRSLFEDLRVAIEEAALAEDETGVLENTEDLSKGQMQAIFDRLSTQAAQFVRSVA